MTTRGRAAIYARFSSDLQRDRSIDDQVALCRDYAARNGYEIVATFEDRAVTGSSLHLRQGIQALLRAARTSAFEFVIAESLSRIARDQEDAPAIRKRLTFSGVQLVTPTDGVVSPLMHGLRTIIDSQFLDDLKGAIRRGMKGVVRDGRHPGGWTYGYRAVPGKPGEPEIVQAEAEIIRRIFSDYIGGQPARVIAAKLNAEGVRPPRGAYWRSSTIGGHSKRGTGILQNKLYCGRVMWNRAQKLRDPDTGQIVYRPNPEAEWLSGERPALRIVDDATFEAAQRVRSQRSFGGRRYRSRPKRMLSGLLRCGACGAGMSKKDTDHGRPRLVCTQMREAGTCTHRRVYYLDEIERLVVGGLRDELGSREAIAVFVRAYNEERHRRDLGSVDRRRNLEHELEAVGRQIDRAVGAVIESRITAEEADRHLPALRRRRDELAAELAALGTAPKVVGFQPAAVSVYLRDLDRLAEVVNGDLADGHSEAAAIIRSMVETVTVMPTVRGQQPGLRVKGDLARLATLGRPQMAPLAGGEGGAG
ncbi:MAG: recombinase family protein [Xanthobacteraceae bacterium]|nr:recombinase family protein [Xanthobacteraceae bacterium]